MGGSLMLVGISDMMVVLTLGVPLDPSADPELLGSKLTLESAVPGNVPLLWALAPDLLLYAGMGLITQAVC